MSRRRRLLALADRSAGRPVVTGSFMPDGRRWTVGGHRERPRFVSGFVLPSIAYLDWAAKLFNGVRVMCGDLAWAGQTAAMAREGIQAVARNAAERGLHLEVVALTGTLHWTEAEIESHMGDLAARLRMDLNILGAVANEPYHQTQHERVHDFRYLADLGRRYFDPIGVAWTCGAPSTDEVPLGVAPENIGDYIALHLNRDRLPETEMIRRLREAELVSAEYRVPVWNGEQIGWAEAAQPGRRSADPMIAFASGVLSRGFELGFTSHAEHGLRSELPGPVQQRCHEAAVRGFTCLGTADTTFKNTGWSDSPIASADFAKVTRCYGFMDGDAHGYVVQLGRTGDPQMRLQHGFRVIGTVDEEVSALGATTVVEIAA